MKFDFVRGVLADFLERLPTAGCGSACAPLASDEAPRAQAHIVCGLQGRCGTEGDREPRALAVEPWRRLASSQRGIEALPLCLVASAPVPYRYGGSGGKGAHPMMTKEV